MLRCKEVVKIVSHSTDNLPWTKRMELRLHLMMCKHCSRYISHLKMLSEMFRRLVQKRTDADRSKVIHVENEVIRKVSK